MKLKTMSPVVVQIGALICITGVLLLARLSLSPHERLFVHALVAVMLGLFFMQIGYAQSLRERVRRDPKKQFTRPANPE
jgi:Na+/melibiose symporter-like transporter